LELGLQRADPLDELLDRLAHGVREVRLVQVDLPGHALTVAICYPAGNAHHNGVRRHLADDHRTGADAAAVADLEPADDLCAGADDDVVSERRVALLALEARPRQAHALVDRDVLPHLRGLADHDTHAVVDEEARTELPASRSTRPRSSVRGRGR